MLGAELWESVCLHLLRMLGISTDVAEQNELDDAIPFQEVFQGWHEKLLYCVLLWSEEVKMVCIWRADQLDICNDSAKGNLIKYVKCV